MSRTCLIVDGLNIFTRHFIANPSTNNNGESIGGIAGTLHSISRLSERFSPNRVVVVWEGGGSIRKRAIYSNYKNGRKPQKLNRYYEGEIPDTIQNRNFQLNTLIAIMSKLSLLQIYVEDCEADDVIGYLCKYKLSDWKKVIISSDKDFYQLLNNSTLIFSPTWKKFVSFKEVEDKFKITAENFCLAKSICGDISDNISGVKGVGFKVLAKRFPLLSSGKIFTISDILSECTRQIENGSKIKVYKSILENEEVIRRNNKLIRLDTNNLAAFQIQKIENIVDTFKPVRNKIDMIKILRENSINNIDIDRVFLNMKKLG